MVQRAACPAMLVMVTGILEFLGAAALIGADAGTMVRLRFDCASGGTFPAKHQRARIDCS